MSQERSIESEDPIWREYMTMLMRRKKNMEVAQIIDKALFEYYSEKGVAVPKWRNCKESWWRDYLIDLGLDPENP